MTDIRKLDAIVIGGGVNGLTAAAYLSRTGKNTALLEAGETVGGLCQTADLGNGVPAPMVAHAFYALDPRVVAELKLTRNGLKFVVRDATTTLLRDSDAPLVITRDTRTTARNISVISNVDAEVWPRYQREMFLLGRQLRAHWWEADKAFVMDDAVERLSRIGAGAWLDSWFESDALKSLLAFDASALSPVEAGSSLLLAWRAAQEMCGLQAATAFPAGGPGMLVHALLESCKAAGVHILTDVRVEELIVNDGRVRGVHVHSGETFMAPCVLSSLSRRRTLLELANGKGPGLAERARMQNMPSPVATAKVLLSLDQLPITAGLAGTTNGRFISAERLESYVFAHAEARWGRIPEEPVMEIVFPTLADPSLSPPGGHVASVVVRPIPRDVTGGWKAHKATLAAMAVARLSRHIPGLAKHVSGTRVLTPDDLAADEVARPDAVSAGRMLAEWSVRIRTPLDGLLLCGEDAEPAPAVSGRAGRIAAALALKGSALR